MKFKKVERKGEIELEPGSIVKIYVPPLHESKQLRDDLEPEQIKEMDSGEIYHLAMERYIVGWDGIEIDGDEPGKELPFNDENRQRMYNAIMMDTKHPEYRTKFLEIVDGARGGFMPT